LIDQDNNSLINFKFDLKEDLKVNKQKSNFSLDLIDSSNLNSQVKKKVNV